MASLTHSGQWFLQKKLNIVNRVRESWVVSLLKSITIKATFDDLEPKSGGEICNWINVATRT